MANPQKPFWPQVDKSGDCWIWTGRLDQDGYGKYRFQLRAVRAHRWSYEEANGPIPAGLIICHHCDNPPCVRPSHLYAGTHADNDRDKRTRGRAPNVRPPASKPLRTPPEVRAEMLAMRLEGHTQKVIGDHLGLSQPYVSKVLREITQ